MLLAAMLALVLAMAIPALAQVSLQGGQETESADVNLTYTIDNSGDYARQCVPALQFGQTGNFNNAPTFLQYASNGGNFEPQGVDVTAEPTIDVKCESTIQQSSAASG
jgi:hypothetical protein